MITHCTSELPPPVVSSPLPAPSFESVHAVSLLWWFAAYPVPPAAFSGSLSVPNYKKRHTFTINVTKLKNKWLVRHSRLMIVNHQHAQIHNWVNILRFVRRIQTRRDTSNKARAKRDLKQKPLVGRRYYGRRPAHRKPPKVLSTHILWRRIWDMWEERGERDPSVGKGREFPREIKGSEVHMRGIK